MRLMIQQHVKDNLQWTELTLSNALHTIVCEIQLDFFGMLS